MFSLLYLFSSTITAVYAVSYKSLPIFQKQDKYAFSRSISFVLIVFGRRWFDRGFKIFVSRGLKNDSYYFNENQI